MQQWMIFYYNAARLNIINKIFVFFTSRLTHVVSNRSFQ